MKPLQHLVLRTNMSLFFLQNDRKINIFLRSLYKAQSVVF